MVLQGNCNYIYQVFFSLTFGFHSVYTESLQVVQRTCVIQINSADSARLSPPLSLMGQAAQVLSSELFVLRVDSKDLQLQYH
jgi:hypothetical protein